MSAGSESSIVMHLTGRQGFPFKRFRRFLKAAFIDRIWTLVEIDS